MTRSQDPLRHRLEMTEVIGPKTRTIRSTIVTEVIDAQAGTIRRPEEVMT